MLWLVCSVCSQIAFFWVALVRPGPGCSNLGLDNPELGLELKKQIFANNLMIQYSEKNRENYLREWFWWK